MLILICKCFIALLLLGSMAYVVAFTMILGEEEDAPKWIVGMYILGIIITIII